MVALLARPLRSLQADLLDRIRGARADLTGQSSLLPVAWLVFILLECLALGALVANLKNAAAERELNAEAIELDQIGPWNPRTVVDPTKVAFLLETRTSSMLVPLLLHYIAVTPPDWVFRFMGSLGSVTFMESIPAIQRQIKSGKLVTQLLPSNISINSQETLSRFYTNPWTYSHLLEDAEMLYVFQNDAMVCSNSPRNLNQFTNYSWVGAPWGYDGGDGGNGGLSLRNATAMRYVTSIDTRLPNTEPEDVWMVTKFHQYGIANLAPYSKELDFSSEGYFYRHPMGYHTGGGGEWLAAGVWGTPRKRAEVYNWCPEVKMVLDMDVAEFLPGHCGETWDGV